MTSESSSEQQPSSAWSLTKLLHYGALLILLAGGAMYIWMKPPTINPVTDPLGTQAVALVQTHRAAGYPTILQAFNEQVRTRTERGQGVRLGEWRVEKLETDRYEVRVNFREQGSNQWFEREFIWHVNLRTKRVNAASLPADGLMPPESSPENVPSPMNVPLPPTS